MQGYLQDAQGCRAGKRLVQSTCSSLSPCISALCTTEVEQKRARPSCEDADMMSIDSSSAALSCSMSSVPSSACSSQTLHGAVSRESSFSACSPRTSGHVESSELEQWRAREAVYTPRGVFKLQSCITPAMREMLVEWMCEVVIQYRMHLETFLLAVNFLDRYLCKQEALRSSFQLLGLTCLWIAAKYEEVHAPNAQQLLEMADNAYSKKEMLALESDIMRALDWQLSTPTALKFMHLYLVDCQATSYTVQSVGECMLQLASLDYGLCAEQPAAHVAAAAACVALTTCQLTHLVPHVVKASGWSDAPALAQMSHDLYARFGQLSAPGMPFHPIIAHYAQRQRAIHRQMQTDAAMSQRMAAAVPIVPSPTPYYAATPTYAPAVKYTVPAAATLHTTMAAKLSVGSAARPGPMDCMPGSAQDQNSKAYLLAMQQQQHLAALTAQHRAGVAGQLGRAVLPKQVNMCHA